MITLSDVVPLLLAACPSFDQQWEQSATENLDNDGVSRLHYLDASDFVRHIVGLKAAGDASELPAVFDVIERLVVDGDPDVQNLATIGYIEGFQMTTVTRTGLDPERDFRPHMRDRSLAIWLQLNNFWEQLGDESGQVTEG